MTKRLNRLNNNYRRKSFKNPSWIRNFVRTNEKFDIWETLDKPCENTTVIKQRSSMSRTRSGTLHCYNIHEQFPQRCTVDSSLIVPMMTSNTTDTRHGTTPNIKTTVPTTSVGRYDMEVGFADDGMRLEPVLSKIKKNKKMAVCECGGSKD